MRRRSSLALCAALFGARGAGAASANAELEVLQLRATGGVTLEPAFTPGRTEYEARVNSDIATVQLRAAAWVGASRIQVNDAPAGSLLWQRVPVAPGANRIVVKVTAPDGQASKAYAVTVHREAIQPVADAFLRFVHTDPGTGLRMPYRLFVPAGHDPARRYPLVLFLHGGGENGDDNEKQLLGTEGATIWAKPAEQARRPCFVLAPQAHVSGFPDPAIPYGGFGITRNRDGERFMEEARAPSVDLRLAVQVLERVQREYGVDPRRVYATGLSQGGFGTWNAGVLRPDLFAALVPIAGGTDPARVGALAGTPVWAWHAEDDQVVPVRYSRETVAALRAAGGSPRYTELPSGTFFDPNEHWSWVYAYRDAAMREWLFAQVRG